MRIPSRREGEAETKAEAQMIWNSVFDVSFFPIFTFAPTLLEMSSCTTNRQGNIGNRT